MNVPLARWAQFHATSFREAVAFVEREVIERVAAGDSRKYIAQQVNCSPPALRLFLAWLGFPAKRGHVPRRPQRVGTSKKIWAAWRRKKQDFIDGMYKVRFDPNSMPKKAIMP